MSDSKIGSIDGRVLTGLLQEIERLHAQNQKYRWKKDNRMMEVRDGAKITTDDFWYGLFEGYIKPEEVLLHRGDAEDVQRSMAVLQIFRKSTESITEEI